MTADPSYERRKDQGTDREKTAACVALLSALVVAASIANVVAASRAHAHFTALDARTAVLDLSVSDLNRDRDSLLAAVADIRFAVKQNNELIKAQHSRDCQK